MRVVEVIQVRLGFCRSPLITLPGGAAIDGVGCGYALLQHISLLGTLILSGVIMRSYTFVPPDPGETCILR